MFDFDGDRIKEGEKLAERVLYIAYGSNLNIAQMEERCPGAESVCSGKLENFQLSFRKSQTGCYLSIDPAEGSSVDVVVWSISSDDEKTLDRREGYPKYYQKTVLPVRAQTNEGEKVLYGTVYYLPLDRQLGPCSREYLERVLAGYEHFGFDPEPLYNAYDRACEAAQA